MGSRKVFVNPIPVDVRCTFCGETITILCPQEGYEKWKAGEGHIQNLMPELTPGERELLISRTCEPCFDRLCKEE